MMKKAKFTPLIERVTRQDKARYDTKGNALLALIYVGLLFVVFITTASVLVLIEVHSLGTLPFWVACGLSMFIFAIWGYIRMTETRDYDIRVKKFAAINNFAFTAKVDRKNLSDEKSFLSKIQSSSGVVYDSNLVKGKHGGIPFKFGEHVAEYSGPEGERTIERVSFLEMSLQRQFPHILLVGGGKTIPRSALKRLWTRPQPITTDFQHYFQVFVLEGRKDWQEIIPPKLQADLLQFAKEFDIEICENTVSFYQKNRFNLGKMSHIFKLVVELCKI